MFNKRNNEEEDYSYYWQLTNAWREDKRFSEDGETLESRRRKVRRADGNVAAEHTFSPVDSPQHSGSLEETNYVGQTSDSETDPPTKKRAIMRENNKHAARKCRQMKKEYVKCLQERVDVLENQNKSLMEELNSLRDLYHAKTGLTVPLKAQESDSD